MVKRSDKFKYKIAHFDEDIPKPKKNEIVIIPEHNRLMRTQPLLAEKHLPEWFQNLPKGKNSLRRCQGTYDYITYGFIVRAWSDIYIRPSINGKSLESRVSQWDADGKLMLKTQGFLYESTGKCPFTENRMLPESSFPKIVSPWRYVTPKGVSLMSLPVWHEPNPNYSIVPGIVHTDFYHQIHLVLNVLTDKEFVIKEGTPIQHMIPIRRKDNFKNILWGNESMFRFVRESGVSELGKNVITNDNSKLYRKIQRQLDE